MKAFIQKDLGEGYYVIYRRELGVFGSYHPVNIMLYRGDELFVAEITDRYGRFLDYPGHICGKWREELSLPFDRRVNFTWKIGELHNGCFCFSWELQPDGLLWSDDGYGITDDNEIWLYSLLGRDGKFALPFSDVIPQGYEEYAELPWMTETVNA